MTTLKRFYIVGLILFGATQSAFTQGTTFTYQGRLNDGISPANGIYDLTFAMFGVSSNGSPVAGPLTNSAVGVTNGLFVVALDFGANFPGADRWLEIGVRTNGTGAFATLSPRQPITATPYAITAGNISGTVAAAQLSGTISSAQLSGTYSGSVAFNNSSNSFTGDGAGLANVNAATLGGLSSDAFWKTAGNTGTSPTNGNFVGTSDNNPLELRVNGQRAWRLQPTASTPNLVGGWVTNRIGTGVVSTVVGATIGGGGGPNAAIVLSGGFYGTPTFYTNLPNTVFASYGTIGGGMANAIGVDHDSVNLTLQSQASTIGGGFLNRISSSGPDDLGFCIGGTIGGGMQNFIHSMNAGEHFCDTIGGGYRNSISHSGAYVTIVGGQNNLVAYDSTGSFVGGGGGHYVDTSKYSVIVGGLNNRMNYLSDYSFIGGGSGNSIGYYAWDGSTYCAIVCGQSNEIDPAYVFSSIGGGQGNKLESNGINHVPGCTIAGGVSNSMDLNSAYAVISGGTLNDILANGTNAVIGGGLANVASGRYATIPGGQHNTAFRYAFAAGSYAQATNQGAFVWADFNTNNFSSTNNNEFAVRATGGVRLVTGIDGTGNPNAGVKLDPAGTSWATISDRNAKKNFVAVNERAVLEKLGQVPVEQWNYKWESDQSVPNLGPMAQDFKRAFYPGRDDKSITTLEFDGVELAAIQGLNQKLEAELERKNVQIDALQRRLEKLEQVVSAINSQPHGDNR
jgi:trimeric autotransporter adhesin